MYLFKFDRLPGFLSMTLFHALAREGVDALVIVSPEKPLISMGYFQDAKQELNLPYLKENKIPLFRREIGGGICYLDENQIFYQVIYGSENKKLPQNIKDAYQVLSEPAIRAHQRFGIPVSFREVNDLITKDGRKIGGEGGANISNSLVFVGSMMMDFDYHTMSQVAKIPDEKWRDKVYKTIEENVSTMKKELGEMPDRYEVQSVLVDEFTKLLGPLEVVDIDREFMSKIQQLESEMLQPDFLFGKQKSPIDSFRIKSDMQMIFGTHKSKGGLIRTVQEVAGPKVGGTLEDIGISGDFTLVPKESISSKLEKPLQGKIRTVKDLEPIVEEFFDDNTIEMPGVTPEDMLSAIDITELKE
ncbi:lipoate--protein ligase family protein [bacterium]|nr:lipoate--protein ligase family protein [bacterium]